MILGRVPNPAAGWLPGERIATISCAEYKSLPRLGSPLPPVVPECWLAVAAGKLYLFTLGEALPAQRGFAPDRQAREILAHRVTKITGVRAGVTRRP